MGQVLSNMNVEELVDFVKVKDKLALNMMFTLLVVVATKLMAIMRTHYKKIACFCGTREINRQGDDDPGTSDRRK